MSEKLFSKAATRKVLGISRQRYEQYIESGILPKPIEITPGSRAVHTTSQIRLAASNLAERSTREYWELKRREREQGLKPMKPLSEKINYTNQRGK